MNIESIIFQSANLLHLNPNLGMKANYEFLYKFLSILLLLRPDRGPEEQSSAQKQLCHVKRNTTTPSLCHCCHWNMNQLASILYNRKDLLTVKRQGERKTEGGVVGMRKTGKGK